MKRNKKGFLTVENNTKLIKYNKFPIINKTFYTPNYHKNLKYNIENNQTLNNIFDFFGAIIIFVGIISLFFCAV